MNFGSDNQTGASDQVLAALQEANTGTAHGYGDDAWTARAEAMLADMFETRVRVFFVATGTAANSLALSCLVQPWQVILCHDLAHIIMDESTAPEFFTAGARTLGISGRDRRLLPRHLQQYFARAGTDPAHNPEAAALSLAQISENGQVYQAEEIAALAETAKKYKLRVQMDGARFANAVAATGSSPADLSWRSGVDVLCLGATKNGALCAEAVIFFDEHLAEGFVQRRKRSGHLVSKGRIFGAQFIGWLQDDHWLTLAQNANRSMQYLTRRLARIPGLRLCWPAEANEAFVMLPKSAANALREAGAEFYGWYPDALPPDLSPAEDRALIRLVSSFKTTEAECDAFIQCLQMHTEAARA